ncbi:hypothetical protein [Streptomyces spinoverrucosus]|nr:hypothetical protein [Streptomyces spinoverrucosus]
MHDTTGQLRFPAGPDAVRLAEAFPAATTATTAALIRPRRNST